MTVWLSVHVVGGFGDEAGLWLYFIWNYVCDGFCARYSLRLKAQNEVNLTESNLGTYSVCRLKGDV